MTKGRLATVYDILEIDCANVSAVGIPMNDLPFREDCTRFQIVAWPTGEHDDLKRMRLFDEKGAEPVHPILIALNELII